MSATDEPILRARMLLDEALIALGTPHEGRAEAAGSIGLLAQALGQVYAALAVHTDVAAYHDRREKASVVLRQALEGLQESPASVGLPGDPVRGAAEALGLLIAPRSPPFDSGYRFPPRPPGPGVATSPTPASLREPRLLPVAREPLVPVVPLPPAKVKPPVAVVAPPDPEQDGAAPLADLAVVRARALAAVAAATPKKVPKKETGKAKAKSPTKPTKLPTSDAEAERETFGEAMPVTAILHDHARGFFEDLGMMSLMRLPDAGDAWRELEPVEGRLLARVDGLLAAGLATLPPLLHLLASRPVPDPELRWAAIFFYGSLAGDDARDQVARLVRTAELEEETVFEAVADALFFAPNPDLETLLRGWLGAGAPSPTLKRLAVRVLGRRRRLSGVEALAAATASEVGLAREGARALASTPAPLDVRALFSLTGHEDEKIVEAALHGAFVHKQAFALERARALFTEKGPAFASSALWLALGGGQDAGPLILQALTRALASPSSSPSSSSPLPPVLFEAAGWFGHVGLVEPLLAALAKGETDAVWPLFRITGAVLTDDEPVPTYDEGALPFARPFEAPSVVELSVDAAVWSAWWKEHRGRAQSNLRYRWGVVWSPALSLWEMAEAPATPKDRVRAHLELVARTGGEVAFDPLDFVVRQEAPLAAWKAHVSSRWRPAQDGSWTNIWGGR